MKTVLTMEIMKRFGSRVLERSRSFVVEEGATGRIGGPEPAVATFRLMGMPLQQIVYPTALMMPNL